MLNDDCRFNLMNYFYLLTPSAYDTTTVWLSFYDLYGRYISFFCVVICASSLPDATVGHNETPCRTSYLPFEMTFNFPNLLNLTLHMCLSYTTYILSHLVILNVLVYKHN